MSTPNRRGALLPERQSAIREAAEAAAQEAIDPLNPTTPSSP